MGSAYDKVLWPCLLYYLYYAISNRVLQNEIDEKEERKRELAPDVPKFSYLTVVWCLWGTHDSVNCPVFVSLKHYIWVYMPTLIKQFTSKNHTKHLEYCKQIQLWPKGKKKNLKYACIILHFLVSRSSLLHSFYIPSQSYHCLHLNLEACMNQYQNPPKCSFTYEDANGTMLWALIANSNNLGKFIIRIQEW